MFMIVILASRLGVREGDNGVDGVANEMCVTNNFLSKDCITDEPFKLLNEIL